MKFVLNGSLIIGTMDGANVEIYQEVKKENIFIFGSRVEAVDKLKHNISITAPEKYLPASLQKVIQSIREGKFSERNLLMDLVSTFTNNNDWYLIGADFESYIKCQNEVLLFFIFRWTNVTETSTDGLECRYLMPLGQESSPAIAVSRSTPLKFGIWNLVKY